MKRILPLLLVPLALLLLAGCRSGGDEPVERTATEADLALWDEAITDFVVSDFIRVPEGENGLSNYAYHAIGWGPSLVGNFQNDYDQTTRRAGEDFSADLVWNTQYSMMSGNGFCTMAYVDGMFYDIDLGETKIKCAVAPAEISEALAKRDTIDATSTFFPHDEEGKLDAPLFSLSDGVAAHDLFLSMTAVHDKKTGVTTVTGRGLDPDHAAASTPWMVQFLRLNYFIGPAEGTISALMVGEPRALAELLHEDILSVSIGVDAEGRVVSFVWTIRELAVEGEEGGLSGESIDLSMSAIRSYETPTIKAPEDSEAYEEQPWREYFHMETPEMLEMVPGPDGIITLSDDSDMRAKQFGYLYEYDADIRFRARGYIEGFDPDDRYANAALRCADGGYEIMHMELSDDVLASLGGTPPPSWVLVEVIFHRFNPTEFTVSNEALELRILPDTEPDNTDPTAAQYWDVVLPTLDLTALIDMKDMPVGTVSYKLTADGLMSGHQPSTHFDWAREQTYYRNNGEWRMDHVVREDQTVRLQTAYVNGVFYRHDPRHISYRLPMTDADWSAFYAEAEDPAAALNGQVLGVMPPISAIGGCIMPLPEGLAAHRLFRECRAVVDDATGGVTLTARGLEPRYAEVSTPWLCTFLREFGFDQDRDGSLAYMIKGEPRLLAGELDEETFSLEIKLDSEGQVVEMTLQIDDLFITDGLYADENEGVNLTLSITCDRSAPTIRVPEASNQYMESHWREVFGMETLAYLGLIPDEQGVIHFSNDGYLRERQDYHIRTNYDPYWGKDIRFSITDPGVALSKGTAEGNCVVYSLDRDSEVCVKMTDLQLLELRKHPLGEGEEVKLLCHLDLDTWDGIVPYLSVDEMEIVPVA